MGELAIKFGAHRFHVAANETVGILDNIDLDLLSSWTLDFADASISNINDKGRMYQIAFTNKDLSLTFVRKLYSHSGLEDQWHFDYKAALLSSGNNLHG